MNNPITKLIKIKKSNPENTVVIHVGKCGGSYFKKVFPRMKHMHMSKPVSDPKLQYIVLVRNPLNRFVSAFNMSKSILEFDVSGYSFDELMTCRETPYFELRNKIKNKLAHNHPFYEFRNGIEFESLILFFGNANNLAEALSSSDTGLQNKATRLMNHKAEHISRGIGWYLDNGDFLDKFHSQVVHVCRLENMNQDIEEIEKELNIKQRPYYEKVREGISSSATYLSDTAIYNLKEFYKNTDYMALNKMEKYGLLDRDTLDRYYIYSGQKDR